MQNISKIKKHFNFKEDDVKNLLKLKPVMDNYKNQVSDNIHNILLSFDETKEFLPDEEALKKRKENFSLWFINLFNGEYDHKYLLSLQALGNLHAKIGLSPHYSNISFSHVRQMVMEVLESNFQDAEERMSLYKSIEKILEINHDIISNSYREEIMGKVSVTYKLENKLIHLSERFTYGLNILLVLALMCISIVVVGLFGLDIYKLITGHMEHGVIHILGTLLMVWVMIELMDTEIEHLKKGKFSITIFVEIVLVAVIRDILIGTLEHDEKMLIKQGIMVGTVLVLAFVYWLISSGERSGRINDKKK